MLLSDSPFYFVPGQPTVFLSVVALESPFIGKGKLYFFVTLRSKLFAVPHNGGFGFLATQQACNGKHEFIVGEVALEYVSSGGLLLILAHLPDRL